MLRPCYAVFENEERNVMSPIAVPSLPAENIRSISDLRTKLPQIEERAKEAPVILNRNGKPALIVQDYESYQAEQERLRDERLLREAEIWDRARKGQRHSLAEVKAILEQNMKSMQDAGLCHEEA